MEYGSEMKQMIEQMEKSNRQQVFYARLQTVFSAAAFVLCLVIAIAVIRVVPQVQDIAGRADVVLTNLETVTEELTAIDMASIVENVDSLVGHVDSLLGNMDSLVGDVDTLVSSSQESLEETMNSINKIDFETLNNAIEDLAAVIEPLANFFNMFDR